MVFSLKHGKTGIFPHYPATTLTIWRDPFPEFMVRKLKKGRLSFLTIKKYFKKNRWFKVCPVKEIAWITR